jgi:hypothetical protein
MEEAYSRYSYVPRAQLQCSFKAGIINLVRDHKACTDYPTSDSSVIATTSSTMRLAAPR